MQKQKEVEPVSVIISRVAYRLVVGACVFGVLVWLFYYLPGKFFYDHHEMIVESLALDRWGWFKTVQARWIDSAILAILSIAASCGIAIKLVDLIGVNKSPINNQS